MAKTAKKDPALTPEEKLAQALVPESEQPYPVPENWCWTKLSYLISTSKEKTEDFSDSSTKYVGLENLEKDAGIVSYGFVDGVKSLKIVFYKGQILYGKLRPYLNKHDVAVFEGVCSTDILVFDVRESAINKYVDYFFNLQLFIEYAVSNSKGINLPRVSENVVLDSLCPLPPLAEQQRIVDRIESLFAKLDEAKEKAQAVVDGFEHRKAAILHKAFTGELTAGWRNVHNVSKAEWANCDLISVLVEKPRNGYSPTPVNYKTPVKSMTLSATTSGVFRSEFFKYIDEDIPEDSHLWLKPGDILIQRANSLEKVGTSALYTGNYHEFIYPDLMMKLQVSDAVDAEYVAYYLKTDEVMQYLRSNATGTAGNMPKINQKTVSTIPFILIPKSEQKLIVQILNSCFEKELQAKEIAEQVIDQIDAMKKSILARAFRGELGTNDPADESAEQLLKRIL